MEPGSSYNNEAQTAASHPRRTILDRYDVIDVIGRGGAAIVYLAEQRDLDRPVALKELLPLQASDPTFARRFMEESRLTGKLSHPNIVTVFEYFEYQGIPYIAVEYVPNGSLRRHIGRLSQAQIAGVLEGVLAGLAYAQSVGVVHRDLKPENLLVSADGHVKIADFGIARVVGEAITRTRLTAMGTTVGTPAYMAPEQAQGGELGPWTDLYSLGVITWEMLIGRVPFEGTDDPFALAYRHVHEPVPPVSSLDPSIDEELSSWTAGLLAKKPEERFRSAEQAWRALDQIIVRLEGPHWRDDARVLEDGKASEHDSLTPSDFARPGPSGRQSAADRPKPVDPGGATPATIAKQRRPGPSEQANDTIAPARKMLPLAETLHRVRQRPTAEEPAGLDEEGRRRRSILLVTGVAALAAAVALGVIAGKHGGSTAKRAASSSSGADAAQIREAGLAGQVAPALRLALGDLVKQRGAALAGMSRTSTPGAQASFARAIATAYSGSAEEVGGLAATVGASSAPSLPALRSSLLASARDYRALAGAAAGGAGSRYAQAAAHVRRDEQQTNAKATAAASALASLAAAHVSSAGLETFPGSTRFPGGDSPPFTFRYPPWLRPADPRALTPLQQTGELALALDSRHYLAVVENAPAPATLVAQLRAVGVPSSESTVSVGGGSAIRVEHSVGNPPSTDWVDYLLHVQFGEFELACVFPASSPSVMQAACRQIVSSLHV